MKRNITSAIVLSAGLFLGASGVVMSAQETTGQPAVYTSDPKRLLDTRNSVPVEAGESVSFTVPSAEILNFTVTAVRPEDTGFLSANNGETSIVSWTGQNTTSSWAEIYSNGATTVQVYSSIRTHVVVDLVSMINFDNTVPTTTVTPTTVTPTTVTPTTVTPTTVTPTTLEPIENDFSETFDNNQGFERFDHGIWHRDWDLFQFAPSPSQTWTGDHDLNCGSPDSQRTISKTDRDAAFYTCRDHLMTSVGDVDGYSLAWFTPNQTFTSADTTTVSFDVNMTNLLARQWWEVVLVDPESSNLIAHPTVAGVGASPADNPRPGLISYPEDSIAVGNGPFSPGPVKINGENQGWQPICTSPYALDPEGCDSKPIRRTWTITDNKNGTVTVDFLDNSWTVDGSFPEEFKVVFKDHNYTPDKDGIPVGHTWHWDNITVR